MSKIKNQNYKPKFKILNFGLSFCILIFGFWIPCYAKEVVILYTGSTHAMLYPCACPGEPDGGVARRAALIKQLRQTNPATLVLDSGSFFAGGLMDEYAQDSELDKERTEVQLKAMELMRYDAVALSEEELNFGIDFLEGRIKKLSFPFLSGNISFSDSRYAALLLPYLIKEVAGTKIGIIAVTGPSAAKKTQGLQFQEPASAVRNAVERLRRSGTNIIVLLSSLGEEGERRLLSQVKGIDILIGGYTRNHKDEPLVQSGSTLILRPSWQGKRLGRLSLTIEKKKIISHKVDQLRLSSELQEDSDSLKILPRCFSDQECRREGSIGTCQAGGAMDSRCDFSEPGQVSLMIISPKLCKVCDTASLINYLKLYFPKLSVSYLYYPDDKKAKKIIKDLKVSGLPVYLLDKKAEKEKSFPRLAERLEKKGNFYILGPQFIGISYFLGRPRLSDKLDLFISLYDKKAEQILGLIREFTPALHFLAVEDKGVFDAANGGIEVEEYLRSVCVQKYYPAIFWDYIGCRAANIASSWWEDCLGSVEAKDIKVCAQGNEGHVLLKENISLTQELKIMFGPVYLLDNQEIFGTQDVPPKEEFRKLIKR